MVDRPEGAAAVDRALAILKAFDENAPALTLAELARRTGFYKSTLLRLSASLDRAGFLRRDERGVFRLGPASLRLAQIYQTGFALGDEAMPVLRALARDTGETASLYVRDGAERVCLFRVEADRPVRAHVREGDRRPLDRGAAGKVLRIFSGETLPDASDIHARRYAVSRGEVSPESAAIAVPVFGAGSRLLGALNLSLPVERLTANIEADLAPQLRRAGDDLSHRLGGAPA